MKTASTGTSWSTVGEPPTPAVFGTYGGYTKVIQSRSWTKAVCQRSWGRMQLTPPVDWDAGVMIEGLMELLFRLRLLTYVHETDAAVTEGKGRTT